MKQFLPLIQRWGYDVMSRGRHNPQLCSSKCVPTFSLVHKNTEKKENIYLKMCSRYKLFIPYWIYSSNHHFHGTAAYLRYYYHIQIAFRMVEIIALLCLKSNSLDTCKQ